MTDTVNGIISNLIEMIILIFVFLTFLKPYHVKINKVKITIIMLYITSVVFSEVLITDTVYITLVILISKLIFLYFLFEIELNELIILFSLSIILTSVVELPVALLSQALNSILPHELYNIVGSLITLILVILIYRFVSLSNYYSKLKEEKTKTLLILVNISFFIIFLSIFFKIKTDNFYQSAIIILISYIIILAINLDLFMTRLKISRQKAIIKTQEAKIKAYSDYLPVISSLIKDVRERQHNYNDKLQAIYSLPAVCKDYDSLKDALKNNCISTSKNSADTHILRLNYTAAAAFLYSKCSQAKQEGKSLEISLPSSNYSTVLPEYILIEVLGILVNNALEATPEGKTVYLKIDCDGGTFGIEVMNPGKPFTEEEKKKIFSPGYSSKKNEARYSPVDIPGLDSIPRGYGLSSLKSLSEQYDFDIIVDNDIINGESMIIFRIVSE